MNNAELATAKTIEATLQNHGSYRKIEDRLYVVKQGSSYVLINILPWGAEDNKALVRCCAQLVRGAEMSERLALDLLELNGQLRFGAFAYEPDDNLVLFLHTILGGPTMDPDELLATLTDVAMIADEYDDKIIECSGGQTMHDMLEEQALERIFQADPKVFSFGEA